MGPLPGSVFRRDICAGDAVREGRKVLTGSGVWRIFIAKWLAASNVDWLGEVLEMER